MATDKSIDQISDMNIDYVAVFDAEFGRLGTPLPTSVARYGVSGIDRIARQLLLEQGKTTITQEDYQAAVRKAIKKVMDPAEQLSDPYNRAARESEELNEAAKAILGKSDYSSEEYMVALTAAQKQSTLTATDQPEEMTPAHEKQLEGEVVCVMADGLLAKQGVHSPTYEQYAGALQEAQRLFDASGTAAI